MESVIEKASVSDIAQLEKKLAACLTMLEQASDKIERETASTNSRFEESEALFNRRIVKIENSVAELKEFMTQSGAARMRISVEKALQEGKRHLAEIQEATHVFENVADESCKKLEVVAKEAGDYISQSVDSLKLEELKKYTEETIRHVKLTSHAAIQRVRRVVNWFRWERIAVSAVMVVTVAMFTGLYINDQAPWQSHNEIVAERSAGKALLAAWPKLSPQDRADIKAAIDNNLV